jgi:hypothetical protein
VEYFENMSKPKITMNLREPIFYATAKGMKIEVLFKKLNEDGFLNCLELFKMEIL